MQSVQGGKAVLGSELEGVLKKLRAGCRPMLHTAKEGFVEQDLCHSFVELGLGDDFQTDERTGCEGPIPVIIQDFESATGQIRVSANGRDQKPGVDEGALFQREESLQPRRSASSRSRPSQS